MSKGKSEAEVLALLRQDASAFVYKISDAGRCPKCYTVVHGGLRPFDVFFHMPIGIAGAMEIKSSSSSSFQFVAGNVPYEDRFNLKFWLAGIRELWDDETWVSRDHGILPHQRKHLTEFMISGGQAWLALMLNSTGRINGNSPRRLFIIPWGQWVNYEIDLIELGTQTASLNPKRLDVRDQAIDLRFPDEECVWVDGSWRVKETSAFMKTYENPF